MACLLARSYSHTATDWSANLYNYCSTVLIPIEKLPGRGGVVYIGIDSLTIVESHIDGPEMAPGLTITVTNPLKYKNNKALVPVLRELKNREPSVNWRIRVFGGKDRAVWSDIIQLVSNMEVEDRFEF